MSKKDEALKLALKKAFDLGKRYWQQANSDFTSQLRKSDVTLASFNQLVEDTIRDALAEQPAQQQVPVAWLARRPNGDSCAFEADDPDLELARTDPTAIFHPLYTHPATQQADRQRVPDGWKVEALSAGDVRVYGPGNETWRLQSNPGQGTFEDFAHRFLSAIAAAPEAPEKADCQRVPDGWRELCRRLYVELFHCDQQMTGGKRPKWTQGKTVRDVLADAKAALEAAAPETPAQDEQVAELVPLMVAQALEALDELEAAARGDEPFNHFSAPLIRQTLKHYILAAAPEAPAQASAADERAAFEAWAIDQPYIAAKNLWDERSRYGEEEYESHEVQLMWEAWKARAALAQKGGAA